MTARVTTTSACLSDAQLAQLQAAAPGSAPADLAQHLAECERCQRRALFGAEARDASRRRQSPELPSLGRALLLLAGVLAAVAAFLYSLYLLAGRLG